MSAITPQSDLYLIKLPIELDNENQLTFASKSAQQAYFSSCTKIGETDFTYQRKDGVIRYPAHIDDILEYNYCMYKNDAYSDKWFYAFIDGMRYVNDGMTEISIKTDVWQTWQFDLTFNKCFVEREHVNDDTIGKHTVPEGLETGEYEILNLRNIPIYDSSNWGVCIQCSDFPSSWGIGTYPSTIGGALNGIGIFGIKASATGEVIPLQEKLDYILNEFDSDNKGEAIKNIYMVPDTLISDTKLSNNSTYAKKMVDSSVFPTDGTSYTLEQPEKLAGNYAPKNNKLFTYPYSYFYLSNRAGANAAFHWEDFPNETLTGGRVAPVIHYKKLMVPTSGLSAKLYFTNYKNWSEVVTSGLVEYGTRLYDYGLNFAKVPTCAWTTDYYTNWLTQNGVNIATSILTGGISGAVSGASAGGAYGAIAGAATNTIGSIFGSLASIYQASITPDQANGDLNSADVLYAYAKCSMALYKMTVRPEYAKVIDDYFSAYGYKINEIKVPNTTGRTCWNFVKTVNCNIHAYAPQEDINEIKDMFNNGITLWHDATKFLDYSQTNSIVTP